ncbi:MAG TPA: tRNA (adenosine(37)-N6)-threonylcarbamoyltransferase complex ATPase subunit type 1 TsaE [Polyangia bacterium]|jgi:tRNA threonylcarbamoyladenosine biosynthesis protein TsaE|nr:tRNA (adenosine(37)-N6)-threonylcarbamoyltransferase complex ATPase subunit type 1 TsaE [Polyangia bacterium]
MVTSRVIRAETAEAMEALGERLGRALGPGDVVSLAGPLGAGKTTFVQGLARGAGVPPERHVASPTFALVNEHPGRVPLVHADLYRITHAAELLELGLDDAFDRAAVAIEWLDRFPDAAPADRIELTIAIEPDGARLVSLAGRGPRGAALVRALAADAP